MTNEKLQKKYLIFAKNGEISSAHNLTEYLPSYKKLMSSKKISNFCKKISRACRI